MLFAKEAQMHVHKNIPVVMRDLSQVNVFRTQVRCTWFWGVFFFFFFFFFYLATETLGNQVSYEQLPCQAFII